MLHQPTKEVAESQRRASVGRAKAGVLEWPELGGSSSGSTWMVWALTSTEAFVPIAAEWLGVDVVNLTERVSWGLPEWGIDKAAYDRAVPAPDPPSVLQAVMQALAERRVVQLEVMATTSPKSCRFSVRLGSRAPPGWDG